MRLCQCLISLLLPFSTFFSTTFPTFSTSPFSSSPRTHQCTSDVEVYAGWEESKEEAEQAFYESADWGALF